MNHCPKCKKSDIYKSLLDVHDKCPGCGFALKEHDAGDGPAFFAMFISGIIITSAAAIIDIYFSWPLWLHAIIWTPIIIIASIWQLRIIKWFLITMQYKHNVLGFKKDKK